MIFPDLFSARLGERASVYALKSKHNALAKYETVEKRVINGNLTVMISDYV